jgi:hypothetical protein
LTSKRLRNLLCCWRCCRDKTHGTQYKKIVLCDGYCLMSFHRRCMSDSERARYDDDPSRPFFCEPCWLGNWPTPIAPARSSSGSDTRSPNLLPVNHCCHNDPVKRTVLMHAIETHRLRHRAVEQDDSSDEDESAAEDDSDDEEESAADVVMKPVYLSHLLNLGGQAEGNVKAQINQPDAERGYTALHYAMRPECLTEWRVTLHLLELGADPNAQAAKKATHVTPMQMAMRMQNPHALLPLLTDARTELTALKFGVVVGQWPGRKEWPLLFVFCVLFAFAEQLIQPKEGVSEASLKQLLSSEPALLDALCLAAAVLRLPLLSSTAQRNADVAWRTAEKELRSEMDGQANPQTWLVDELFALSATAAQRRHVCREAIAFSLPWSDGRSGKTNSFQSNRRLPMARLLRQCRPAQRSGNLDPQPRC